MMRHWREREFAKKLSPPRLPQRAFRVGVARAPPGALSRVCRDRQPGAGLGRGEPWPVSRLAARRGLDRGCATCRRRRAAAFTASGRERQKSEGAK